MAMNRNMTMAEKEVRDYAKRQMERAEQRESILFTEEQKEQVLEYAAMTGDDYDIRKMVRDLATALRFSDEEKVYCRKRRCCTYNPKCGIAIRECEGHLP